MNYIAYGSNMNLAQMAIRCPGAKLNATGDLLGYRLEFNRHATIVESDDPAAYVPVAVWDIDPKQELRLDRYESYPHYYRKISCTINLGADENIQGMAYQMRNFDFNPPDKLYFQGILEAYDSLGLRPEIKHALLPALMRSHRLKRQ